MRLLKIFFLLCSCFFELSSCSKAQINDEFYSDYFSKIDTVIYDKIIRKSSNGNIDNIRLIKPDSSFRVLIFDINGKIISDISYSKNGEMYGPQMLFYPDGKMKVIAFIKGQDIIEDNGVEKIIANGDFIAFYPNGLIEREFTWAKNSFHNIKKEFYENGNIKSIFEYNYGSILRVIIELDKEGNIVKN